MKKITLVLVLLLAVSGAYSQIVNEPANWPNTAWLVEGTGLDDADVFEADPTLTANFAYDDDDAGSGTDNEVSAASPIIDLSAAASAGETWMTVSGNYVHRFLSSDFLIFQYWDADAETWNDWGSPFVTTTTAAPFDNFCSVAGVPYTTEVLNIFSFTATQLSGFKYRIYYNDDLDGSGWNYGFCFESPTLTSETPPTCPVVSGISVSNIGATTADIAWAAGGSETQWEVAVQPAGTGEPAGSGEATSNNPYTATGLTAVTDYEVYVRANCDADGFSNWQGPVNFLTACDVFVPFYSEDFATIIPNCWDEANNGTAATGPLELGAGSWGADGYLNNGFSGAYKINLWVTGKSDWILSPQFDLTGGPYQVDFDFAIMEWGSSSAAGTLGSDDIVQLLISADNGATWTVLITYDKDSVIPASGIQVVYDLSAYAGQIVQFGILGSEGTVNDEEDNDVFVDNFRVRDIPSCQEPSDLAVANITETTADLSWTANAGETSWEIINQDAGGAAPTESDSGIATSDNPYQATGLVEGGNYEFYVRAVCGTNDVSLWVGPSSYRISGPGEVCEDPIIVTTPLPYITSDDTANYLDDYNGSAGENCGSTFGYLNGDDVVYAYTPDVDTSVDIELSELTDNYAGVFVYTDCADIGTNCQAGALNSFSSDDLAIDDFIVTGGTTYYIVISTWASPQSTGYTLTIRENTCINPTAGFQVVNDCENGEQFLVDVNVTSFGDAESLTISTDFNATTVEVTELGTYQVGPFPFLTDVTISINNDQDSNCFLNETFQLLACPPDNDNPCDAIEVAVNTDSSCDLTTSGSLIEATPSGVPNGSCEGNPDDDVWFQFVAENEVQVISILNNTGTFNIDHGLYEGSCEGLVELACTNGDASVSPQLVVGNTYYLRVFSGGSNPETNTFDICIKKAPSNLICENAVNFCAEDGGALISSNIIGVPSIGEIACLSSTPNPTWNIIQIGSDGLIEIQIDQIDDQGEGLDVDFALWGPFDSLANACGNLDTGCPDPDDCPNNNGFFGNPDFYPFGNIIDCSWSAETTENLTIDNALSGEIYVLLVTNFSGDPGTISIAQTNGGTADGTITAEIEVELGADQEFCGFPDYVLNAESPFADSYVWYADGFVIEGETEATLTVTETNIYTVIAFDEQCGSQAEDSISITFGQEAIANPVEDIVTCDDATGDEVENFDLEMQTATILGEQDPAVFNVTYYVTLQDAQTSTNPLTSPYNNVSNPQTIFVRVEDTNANFCFATTSFDLVISGPTPTAASVDIEACDEAEGNASFDLAAHDVNILDGQSQEEFTVSYYENEADAEAGTNAIDDSTLYGSNSQTLYARVESNISFDCYSTTAFDLIVKPLPNTTFAEDFDYEVCPDATVPIMINATAGNYEASAVTIQWYRDGGLITGETNLSLAVLEAGTYEIQVSFNDASQCSSSAAIEVIELENCVIPEGISPNGDGKNDTFDLSSYDVSKLEIFNRNGTRVYQKRNYTNEWFGQSDDGEDLPVGTYFYTMEYQNGKQRAAWVYIQRLN
ncbi:T9SS type B sorting domain-containing protein [Subsaximicrobium wynnwilliamsii]|uniref:T9SS type B sorting domain-containing protein n=1 Tax=Subsaximicrobium wynnwilliamsii TaxID=291179 RepID=A0A5C6ZGX4_9FLAO|nr:gliding motility-associated C-terminal domain-containing protein [Subsaximicrobium wynnwilliamsii]TXD83725.1 T9SS type B sorting domain-containing protein [Subsaximicrobium wynnwilliamsii]TXD89391.1 T9SS type B sorting domain-containing protein [Subsaximicrobium wynnwilliamsii]TXE03562.1 T9SS type B sorting domain-containing protein [Subsaximicrobium wynnwilliamsii]